MTPRLIAALALAAAVVSCAPPPPYPNAWGAQAVTMMGPLNAEPWVGTWSPTAWYQGASQHQPFQTPNSLPVGAWTIPGR